MSDKEIDYYRDTAIHHQDLADDFYDHYLTAERQGNAEEARFQWHRVEHHRGFAIFHATMAVAEELRSARIRQTP